MSEPSGATFKIPGYPHLDFEDAPADLPTVPLDPELDFHAKKSPLFGTGTVDSRFDEGKHWYRLEKSRLRFL